MSPAQSRRRQVPETVIWHQVECGSYQADLGLWRALAREQGDPILEIGAGSGRVTLALARAGHRVTALDRDSILLDELARRARGLPVQTAHADARELALGRRFSLIAVPMQTVQLFGGSAARQRFLERAAAHLDPGGLVAVAITERLYPYQADGEGPAPLPDILEHDGVIYCSHPTAVREDGESYLLERRRERTDADGRYTASRDLVRLDRLSARQLEREGVRAGLRPAARCRVAATPDHVGSVVVLLRG
jgi:SAM-dependent methyltransferase